MGKLNNTSKIILVVVIIVLINLISLYLFTRIDLTADRRYSISNYSKEFVRNLDDKFTIKCFFSSEIPYPYNNLRRDVKDKLEEFKAFASRYFQFEFVKAEDEQKLAMDARRFGIPEVQLNTIENDQIQIKKVVMGMVFMYEDKTEVLPIVQSTENLEYEIASKMNKLIKVSLPTIAFLQGHDEVPFPDKMQTIQQMLQANYNLKPVNLKEDPKGLDDAEILVIAGPKSEIPYDEKYLIDQFIMKGKKVMFLVGNVEADINTGKATYYENDMNEWFGHYGFEVKRNLLFDKRCSSIQVRQQYQGGYAISYIQYPFILDLIDLNRENIIVKDLKSLIMAFASSIETTQAEQDSMEVIWLARSSELSGTQVGQLNINLQYKIPMDQYNRSKLPVAALLLGNYNSYFKDNPLPDSIDTTGFLENGVQSRLLVVGNASFVQDDFANQNNATFFANVVDWMAQEKGLIEIRSKNIAARQLKDISDGSKGTIKFIAVLLPPIIVILVGILLWRIKKTRYARIKRFMGV
ncbi:MAG: Gldg family protein [Candidatus Cloacimonetes bacterium]|nr:Gldg family protein [Candidatus Cloacimonadota bacterium]